MLSAIELNDVKKLISTFKPENGHFENNILIPLLRSKVKNSIETFELIIKICSSSDAIENINAALNSTYDPIRLKYPTAEIPNQTYGKFYAESVSSACQTSYIAHAREILEKYSDNLNESSTNDFITETYNYFLKISGVKEDAFLHHFMPSLTFIDRETGVKTIVGAKTIDFILRPVQARMNELVKSAETGIESIDLWRKSVRDQQLRHVDLILSLSNVKATKLNLWVQFAVVLLAVVLSFAASPIMDGFGLYEKNSKLQLDLDNKSREIDKLKIEILSLKDTKSGHSE